MRTKRATAPDNLELLLKSSLRTFTVMDVVELLNLSNQHARAAIDYGVSLDKIRVLKHPQESGVTSAIYENPIWRKKWLTRSWTA